MSDPRAPSRAGRRAGRGGARRGDEPILLYGLHPVLEALRARRRRFGRLRLRRSLGETAPLEAAARAAGVPVEWVEAGALAALLPPGVVAQGAALEVGPLPEADLDALAASPRPSCLVALDGVEDPQNVGAIARVAEAAGAGGLVLTRRHAPPLGAAASKASAGALEWLPVARVPNLPRALKSLKEKGFWVFGADPAAAASAFEIPPRWRGDAVVLVLGAEGRGLRPGVAQAIDHSIRIPMAGRVASLNVATAAAVLLFELTRQNPGGGPRALAAGSLRAPPRSAC
jgi:23S rRNA (guanosine2251-2'-O)-methyltransferase